jgi:hypothetical protein
MKFFTRAHPLKLPKPSTCFNLYIPSNQYHRGQRCFIPGCVHMMCVHVGILIRVKVGAAAYNCTRI